MTKVLVVDDDADLLEMMTLVLKSKQMEVYPLGDASMFFDILRQFKPDFIVMDIFLGNADGRELCFDVKNNQSLAMIPVLLYSAGNVTSLSIKQSRADIFLQKPFDISHLIQHISKYVKN